MRWWTLLGVPALSMPVARSANGLPLAIQLVGGFGEDQHLLQTAKWVEQNLTNPFAEA
ncbi:amidase family protein [Filomicrobium insigne]|uniref:amidase family protein n=1 Tax=Filomicrobium insigne TaxID=418854 RepID=UPI0011144E0B|nr:amidase family protein [Filomicrobium insigne]